MKHVGFSTAAVFIALFLIGSLFAGFLYVSHFKSTSQSSISPTNQPDTALEQVPQTTKEVPSTQKGVQELFASGSGLPFEQILKSVAAQEISAQPEISTQPTAKKKIRVQIFAFEDTNGNGVKEPGENVLGFMPVAIYDSPFADTPRFTLNSTGTGWAGATVEINPPYQIVVNPLPTKDYYPTTQPILLSANNNFAVAGYQKKQEQIFHITVFAFEDVNKNTNIEYDDPKEKPLFLAPFKFYQQTGDGAWQQLPNSVNTTGEGWATTTLSVKYPYRVKVEAGNLNTLMPSNKEIILSSNKATLIFPYTTK